MKTKIIAMAAVLAAMAIAFAVRAARATRTKDAIRRGVVEQQAGWRRLIDRAEARRAAAEAGRLKLPATRDELSLSANSAARPAVLTLDPKRAAALEAIARTPWDDVVLEKNPALQARYLGVRRHELMASYGAFWTAERMTDAQQEKFVALMIESTERSLDLKSTMRVRGLAENDPAVATLRDQSDEKTRAAQRALLGEDGYGRLQDYERSLPVRNLVDTLAGPLAFTDAPLSASQAEQLTQLFANASEAYRRGGKAEPVSAWFYLEEAMRTNQPARDPVWFSDALEPAKAILSPPQFARLEAEVVRTRTTIRAWNLIRQTPGEPVVGFTWGRP